jgi:hypothetical protein
MISSKLPDEFNFLTMLRNSSFNKWLVFQTFHLKLPFGTLNPKEGEEQDSLLQLILQVMIMIS